MCAAVLVSLLMYLAMVAKPRVQQLTSLAGLVFFLVSLTVTSKHPSKVSHPFSSFLKKHTPKVSQSSYSFPSTPYILSTPSVTSTPYILSTPSVTSTPYILSTPSVTSTPYILSTPSVTSTPYILSTPSVTSTPYILSTPSVTSTYFYCRSFCHLQLTIYSIPFLFISTYKVLFGYFIVEYWR